MPADKTEDLPNKAPGVRWQQVREQLILTPEERLLLKMVFQEGLKLKVVAKSLNMPPYQPGRLLKSLLLRIRQHLQDAGLTLDPQDQEFIDGRAKLAK